MSVYAISNLADLLNTNEYPGRGIVIGKSADGNSIAVAYFIMGRSNNSRNRIFTEEGDTVTIYPADSRKVEDPSLIIYHPIRRIGSNLIVTNGDQTDTIYEFLKDGNSFEEALETRRFEPDGEPLPPGEKLPPQPDYVLTDYRVPVFDRLIQSHGYKFAKRMNPGHFPSKQGTDPMRSRRTLPKGRTVQTI